MTQGDVVYIVLLIFFSRKQYRFVSKNGEWLS